MLPLWMEHRKEVLADWIAANPGTRPSLRCKYDAPRLDASALGLWSRTVMAPRLIELRRKLRGEGEPLHEVLNYVPAHDYGIPAWCGNPADTPTFEPQRTYLKRHGLLLPADRAPSTSRFRIRCAWSPRSDGSGCKISSGIVMIEVARRRLVNPDIQLSTSVLSLLEPLWCRAVVVNTLSCRETTPSEARYLQISRINTSGRSRTFTVAHRSSQTVIREHSYLFTQAVDTSQFVMIIIKSFRHK
ncbi:hypothetical protein ACVKN3_003188 [Luteibacter sp. PvP120]